MKSKRSALTPLAVATVFAAVLAFPATPAAQRVQGGDDRGDSGGSRGGAVSRGGGGSGGGGGTAVPRGGDGGGRAAPAAPSPRTDNAAPSPRSGSGDGGGGTVSGARSRQGRPAVGRAIPRGPDAPSGGGGTIIITDPYYGGYYPWGYGGLGFGGYYGYYDPWYYDPYRYGGGYNYYNVNPYAGRLRIKVQPNEAEVFVDGYYAGIVDEFDNPFQHLRIETGPHRIEIREEGYEPLTFEVRILPGETVTYRGELRRIP